MRFSWVACQPNCRGWVSAVGIVTADSPKDFDDFAHGRELDGATIVLDSSGGSVNDAIALGRRLRDLGALTTVGISIETHTAQGDRASVAPEAYCELMCVFLLLSGKTRYVPEAAHVRVHQIWMGDRADDAKAASYTAQDLMIVERDIGRLAKYTFDMGGAGDLLSLSLNVPPWEDLHELSPAELRLTNLVTTDAVAEVLPHDSPMHRRSLHAGGRTDAKPVQDRFVSEAAAQAEADQHAAEVDQDGGGAGADRRRCVGDQRRRPGGNCDYQPCALAPAVSPWLRSGRSHRPRHRRSASSRRAAPCSRAPARAARCRPICLAAGCRFPSASCGRSRATRAIRSRSSRPHGSP